MSEVPVQVVVAAFRTQTAANEVLDELKMLQDAGQIKIDAAAVLDRDLDNKLRIRDTRDWGFGRGALAGGAAGVVLGLMAGPVGWAMLGGALVGGVAAKMHHTYGFNEARLRKLGDSLQPGSSAIVAVVEHYWVAQVEEAMREKSTDVLVESISKDVAEQLAAGKDVGYTALSTGDAIAAQRYAANESELQISDVTYTSEGVFAEAADIQKDHITYEAALADSQGVSGVVIDATPVPATEATEATEGDEKTRESPPEAQQSTPTS